MKQVSRRQEESRLSRRQRAILNRNLWRMAAVIAALALMMAMPAGAVWAAGSCSTSISSCGCTITAPGFYQVTQDLSAGQGLTSDGNCIDINSVGVTLWLAGYNVTGSGSGAGIELNSVGTFVEGAGPNQSDISEISDWNYGVELKNAIHVNEDDVISEENATAGIYLTNSVSNTIGDSDFDGNGTAGIYLTNSSNNSIHDADGSNNTLAGIYLSNSINNNISNSSFDSNGTAGVLLDHSSGNNINGLSHGSENQFGYFFVSSSNNQINTDDSLANAAAGIEIGCPNTTVWSGCKFALPSNGNQISGMLNQDNEIGIEVENGNHNNVIANTETKGSTTTDMVDNNPSCDQDLWFANSFHSANQSCIH